MSENLEGKAGEPVQRELDDETLAYMEEARREYRKKVKPILDAIRASERLTAEDYNVRMTI